jgi:hypothetical protein
MATPGITINLAPARVREVLFLAGSDREHELLLSIWPTIRPLVDLIDRELHRNAEDLLANLED